ncbi:MAG: response regulator [Planctomycetes bacterium]|nr:response regulator [Planctomycetota bacterium]
MAKALNKTILVVDDEPNVRQYLKMVLEDAGFAVLTAEDGVVALEIIREKKPDLISLDLVMPRKSGHKLLFELKRDKELSRIPVLVVTAHAKDDLGKKDLQDLLENRVISGPGTYLEKPVKPLTYVRSIQRALGMPEAEEAEDKINLKEEIGKSMQGASPDALRQALEILKKKGKEG